MIKIAPLFAPDATQVRALLRHQDQAMPYETFCAEDGVNFAGLTFWQHWLPCNLHLAPSIYVAKEERVVLGLISLRHLGKSRSCWKVDHLVVHPTHRGRGIAQELLRFAFALFGSQGVSHLIAEISDQNSAGLSLLGSCGFRRSAKITHYQVPTDFQENFEAPDLTSYRLATPADKQALYQLHRDCLPPDLRKTFDLSEDDFIVPELKVETMEKMCRALVKGRVWYWVQEDVERKVLTSAVRVHAHREGDYHLEFAVHPGWQHTAPDLVRFTLKIMRQAGMRGIVIAKAFDFQTATIEALESLGMERCGSFSLLTREHWIRAKKPQRLPIHEAVQLPNLGGRPVINLPRSQFLPASLPIQTDRFERLN